MIAHDAALDYAARHGWHVLQVHPRSKKPVLPGWQGAATTDPAVIASWWPPGAVWNVGVQLGARSNLVDVECDSPEAERALAGLLGDDYPVVPTFAAKRGNHRLFLWSPDFPCPDKAYFHFRSIEFRTGAGDRGAQSLFPPSIHPDGPVYTWLVHPDEADPAPFPAAALAVMHRDLDAPAPRRGTRLADGEVITEGRRNDTLFRTAARMRHFGHTEAEILALLLAMNDGRCDPPLGEDEVRTIAASAIRYPPSEAPAAPVGRRRGHVAFRVCRQGEVG
jgi:putative DNA primase/helicase